MMPRRLISMRIDESLLEAARKQARRERRTITNLIEVALEGYLAQKGATPMVYVYRHQDGHGPERVAGPMTEDEARAYITARAVDEHGNLSSEADCPYLYVADAAGRPLDD